MLSSIVALSTVVAGVLAVPAPAYVAVAPSFEIRSENTTLLDKRAQPINYNQDYIAGGANVQYTPNQGAGSFSVNYNTQADFVVGLGWTTGDSNPITYSGSFTASGVGILSVYGWTTNPLVEYYIMETHVGYQTVGTKKGTVTSDGATYDIWEHQQTNQPSIQGTSTFQQYISIRQTPRTSGTITIANHFNAWKAAGLNLGTMNYQVLAVESWSGSGSGTLTLSKGTAGSSPAPAPTSSAPVTAPTTPTSPVSGTVAQYGQCGGTGYTGPTACVAPYTCKAANSYYSQCL